MAIQVQVGWDEYVYVCICRDSCSLVGWDENLLNFDLFKSLIF